MDGCSIYGMWLKYSNNNKGINVHRLFKEDITNHLTPLQVRGDKWSENRVIAKHKVMLHNIQHKGYIGGRLTHNTRIDFLEGMKHKCYGHFRDEFEKLETFEFLENDDNMDMWVLHCMRIPVVNWRIAYF